MSETMVYLLLALALVIPVPGALLIRLVERYLSEEQVTIGGMILVTAAIVSVLLLVRSNVTRLYVGDLAVVVPLGEPITEIQLAPQINSDGQPNFPELLPEATTTAVLTATVDLERASPSPSPSISMGTATATARPTRTVPPRSPEQNQEARRHTLESGDTLSSIAEEFNISIQTLLEANDLTEDDAMRLQPGQELLIPIASTRTPTPTPATETESNVVEPGDTIGSIAEQLDVPVDVLLDTDDILPSRGR